MRRTKAAPIRKWRGKAPMSRKPAALFAAMYRTHSANRLAGFRDGAVGGCCGSGLLSFGAGGGGCYLMCVSSVGVVSCY